MKKSSSITFVDTFKDRYQIKEISSVLEYDFIKNQKVLIPYLFSKKHQVLPLEERDESILVAMIDPLKLEAIEELRVMLKKDIAEVVVSQAVLDEGMDRLYQSRQERSDDLFSSVEDKDGCLDTPLDDESYDLLDTESDSSVIKILNSILKEAILQGASDIHLDPLENGLGIRYRIDGVLQQKSPPPKELHSQLITRLKVISRLDIAEKRLPQDGRVKLFMGSRQVDLRVSTIPCVNGERIVLRILDKSNVLVGLQKIGMRDQTLSSFEKLIQLSEGIVLVTGPTGSGKTTTLYSALSFINSSEVNVMTVEDPVEYKLQGMAQIGVNPKISMTFATGLRHILRQDPDVIMIGEIRDRETAEIAIQASLTGHLVLSTLHTNDAPSALTRLIDMGIEPYLLTSSVAGVLAQRLVRAICPHCKKGYGPSSRELGDMQLKQEELLDGMLYKGMGCDACFGSGYRGRHAIYELMIMNSALKQQLLISADAHQLQEVAQRCGVSSLRKEGALLVKMGITTPSEVIRATRGCQEL